MKLSSDKVDPKIRSHDFWQRMDQEETFPDAARFNMFGVVRARFRFRHHIRNEFLDAIK